MKTTRRKFMQFIGSVTMGFGFSAKALSKPKKIDSQQCLSKESWEKLNRDMKRWFRRNCRYGLKGYNVIDDLVEEMNRNDAEHPGQEFRYFIHCNYSGLGWLDKFGKLEKGIYAPYLCRGYKHILTVPFDFGNIRYMGIKVRMDITQKADIKLVCCKKEECLSDYDYCNIQEVTTRCCNIDYGKRGKALMEKV